MWWQVENIISPIAFFWYFPFFLSFLIPIHGITSFALLCTIACVSSPVIVMKMRLRFQKWGNLQNHHSPKSPFQENVFSYFVGYNDTHSLSKFSEENCSKCLLQSSGPLAFALRIWGYLESSAVRNVNIWRQNFVSGLFIFQILSIM